MKRDAREQFRQQLLAMRDRVANQAGLVADAIREEVITPSDASSAPVHLADLATTSVDADAEVLATEHNILGQIDAALARLDGGSFGKCEVCRKPIDEERLKAIPYAAHCVKCAATADERKRP